MEIKKVDQRYIYKLKLSERELLTIRGCLGITSYEMFEQRTNLNREYWDLVNPIYQKINEVL